MTDAERTHRFRLLYMEHYAAILGYCLRRSPRDHAPDIAADVFTVAWRRLDDIPRGDGQLPWLYGVAAKTIANHRRGASRRSRLTERLGGFANSEHDAAEVQVVRRAEDQEIVNAINNLRDADREVLLLSAWEGLPASQIAARFNISAKAAEKRLTRAKKRLASELASRNSRSIVVNAPQTQEGGSR